MAYKLILLFLLASIQFKVGAQISFYKVYGGNGVDNGQGLFSYLIQVTRLPVQQVVYSMGHRMFC
jgi:hypothetical protein